MEQEIVKDSDLNLIIYTYNDKFENEQKIDIFDIFIVLLVCSISLKEIVIFLDILNIDSLSTFLIFTKIFQYRE